MSRTSEREIERRKKAAARYLLGRGADRRRIAVSRTDLAGHLDLTDSEIRTVVKRLVDDGLITMRSGYRNDGGQMANLYRLTARGKVLAEEG